MGNAEALECSSQKSAALTHFTGRGVLRAHRGLALHGPMHMLRQSIAVSVACTTSQNQPLALFSFSPEILPVMHAAWFAPSWVGAGQHTTEGKAMSKPQGQI